MTDSELHTVISACLAQIAPEADVSSLPPTENIRDALDIDSFDFLQFLIALSEMKEAAGVLGVDNDIHAIEASLVDLHTKAGLAAMEKAH